MTLRSEPFLTARATSSRSEIHLVRQISSNEMDCSAIDENLVALLSDLVTENPSLYNGF